MSSIDIKGILELLPHRYPFIMVDRILALEKNTEITGLKNVTMNEQFFQGHFPQEPVMPGVLQLEGMAQVGAILAYVSAAESIAGKLVYFAGIDKVRFRQKVIPGDQIIFRAEVIKQKKRLWKMAATAHVGETLACEAELMATFG